MEPSGSIGLQGVGGSVVLAKKAGGALLKDVEHLASYEPQKGEGPKGTVRLKTYVVGAPTSFSRT